MEAGSSPSTTAPIRTTRPATGSMRPGRYAQLVGREPLSRVTRGDTRPRPSRSDTTRYLRPVSGVNMADVIWAVRHGQRADSVDPNWEANAERLHDPQLTELGRWAAWRVGRRFSERGPPIDAVYASPFLRAVETAGEICREINAEFVLEPGLGEHRNADWFDSEPETVPQHRLADRFETLRLDHEPYLRPDFPESHEEAMERVGETTRHIAAAADGTVLLVGHGLTIGGIVRGLVGSADAANAPLCGLTRLEHDGERWQLDFSGDTAHLDP